MPDHPDLSSWRPKHGVALLSGRVLRWMVIPQARRRLLAEAGLVLLAAWWQVRRWPFRRLASTLGDLSKDSGQEVSPADALVAKDIQWAVGAWLRHWPWPPTCLMQAVAGQRMLATRGVETQLFFGVSTKAELARLTPGLAAHAWLKVGDFVVTGAQEAKSFKPLAVYRLMPKRGGEEGDGA